MAKKVSRSSLVAGASLLCAALVGCAAAPQVEQHILPVQGVNQKPELRRLDVAGRINFGYRIQGDPAATPSQVFDDGVYQYLQFRQGEPPPIPMTHDGKLLEYEVLSGGLVRVLKQPVVVLRMGPRSARVEHEDVQIVGLSPLGAAPPSVGAAGLSVEPPPDRAKGNEGKSAVAPDRQDEKQQQSDQQAKSQAVPLAVDLASNTQALQEVMRVASAAKRVLLCHAPVVADLRRAKQLQQALQDAGVTAVLSDACDSRGRVLVTALP